MMGLQGTNSVFHMVRCAAVLIVSLIVTEHRVSAVTCTSGWTKYGENCYRLYTTKRPWMDALKACQTVGSSLVDVGSDGEQNFVHQLARNNEFWISGSDSSTENQWLWYGSIQSWRYTKWNSGEPNNAGGEDCASLLTSGRWNDYSCSRSMAYICEQTTALSACDSTWSFRSGKCYKLFTSKVTWSNALKTCQANSANLVNIEDSSENAFVHGLMGRESIWMGGFDGPKENSWAWSGGVFSWRYTNWNSGEPNNSGDEDCAMMYESSGKWNDGKCSGALQFMCKKYTPPINGGWSSYGSYGSCSRSCGGGTRTRSRTCTNPSPQWGGDQCPGSSTQSQSCNTHSCPVHGKWGSWGGYGSCTRSCGSGTKTRSRSCNNPAPAHGGNNCAGSSTSSASCNTHHCPVHGNWGSWGSYGSCTKSCASGTKTRSRSCNNPAPAHGGNNCAGSSTSSASCNTHNCPIHGNWGSWGSYGACTKSCAGGTKTKSRSCNNPAPQYNGRNCAGSSTSTADCNTHHCPIHGNWVSWTSWGSCTVTCGGGTKDRSRTCTNPAPRYNGRNCVGSGSSRTTCNTHHCPIDGVWAAWSSWGSCTVTCGGGTKDRSRTCTNPRPQYLGKDCPGSADSRTSCNTHHCPIDGKWAAWGSWGTCTETCGGGIQSRSRTCTNPTPQYKGKYCTDFSSATQRCNTHNCPIDGAWAAWGNWNTCTVTCGGGTQGRKRTCTNPAPQYGGANCPGSTDSRQSCNSNPCPIDGNWANWGSWKTCSVTCGGGTQDRDRSCTNPSPQHGGARCPGTSTSSQNCNTQVCIIDGAWTNWSQWGGCSKSCGGGKRSRSRTCDNPKPANGGKSCTGGSGDFGDCNTDDCPTVAAGTYQQLCPTGYFTCKAGSMTCIQKTFQCDCASDCDDGSDETSDYAGCTNTLECGEGGAGLNLASSLVIMMSLIISVFLTL